MSFSLFRLEALARKASRSLAARVGGALLTAALASGCGSSDAVPGVLSGSDAGPLSRAVSTSLSAMSTPAAVEARRVKTTTTNTNSTTSSSVASSGRNWAGVRSFACQFNDLDWTAALNSAFDMLVIDYSRDGSDPGAYTAAEVRQLQAGGKRRVVAYLSLGEAENYRYYWKKGWKPNNPAWLGPRNPDWDGNFKVRYWQPEWQSLVYGSSTAYLDKILAAGYDGVFLDVVDGYEYWQDRGRPTAGAEMSQLVQDLTAYARSHGGGADFGVFLNGGEGLIGDTRLLGSITGLAKEDMFFGLDGLGLPSDPNFTQAERALLQPAVASGKLVLSIDYALLASAHALAHQNAAAAGYLEYVSASLSLDSLTAQLF